MVHDDDDVPHRRVAARGRELAREPRGLVVECLPGRGRIEHHEPRRTITTRVVIRRAAGQREVAAIARRRLGAAAPLVVAERRVVRDVAQRDGGAVEELLPVALAGAVVDDVAGAEQQIRRELVGAQHQLVAGVRPVARVAHDDERQRLVVARARRGRPLAGPAAAADLDAIAVVRVRQQAVDARRGDGARGDLEHARRGAAGVARGDDEARRRRLGELPHHLDRRRADVLHVRPLAHRARVGRRRRARRADERHDDDRGTDHAEDHSAPAR